MTHRKPLVVLFVFIIALAAALGVYATFIEPFSLKVTQYRIATPKWTADEPLTVALISDTHAIWPWMTPAHLEQIVRETNALKPDLVLLLGDYVATHPFGIQLSPEDGVAPYKKLSAPCGVFSVIGNHDLHGSRGWPEALEKTGIPVLRNQAQQIRCGQKVFWVAGLEDLWWENADVAGTLAQVTTGDPVILMMHNPDSFPEVPPAAVVALSVAGHTHGGQIRLPFLGAVAAVVPSRYGLRYVYGHVTEEGKDLVVTGGLGTTGLPLRFLMPPEIALIRLEKP